MLLAIKFWAMSQTRIIWHLLIRLFQPKWLSFKILICRTSDTMWYITNQSELSFSSHWHLAMKLKKTNYFTREIIQATSEQVVLIFSFCRLLRVWSFCWSAVHWETALSARREEIWHNCTRQHSLAAKTAAHQQMPNSATPITTTTVEVSIC